jgi:hypothetical protein
MTDERCHNCNRPHTTGRTRCIACRESRKGKDWERRRAIAEAVFPPRLRSRLLGLLRAGVPLREACEDVGVSVNQAHRFASYNESWGEALDAALMAGRDPGLAHGTEHAYRWGGCRCPECRNHRKTSGYWARA